MDDECYIVVVDEKEYGDSVNAEDIKVKIERLELEWLEDEVTVDEQAKEDLIRVLEGEIPAVKAEIKEENVSNSDYYEDHDSFRGFLSDSEVSEPPVKKKRGRGNRSKLTPCNIKIHGKNLNETRRVLQPCFIKIIEKPENEIKTVRPITKTQIKQIEKLQHRKVSKEPFNLCPICSKFVKDLTRHLKVHDDERQKIVRSPKTYYCGYCSAEYKSRQGLEAHENAHLNNRPYKCAHCPRSYTSSTALRQHIKQHFEFRYTCPICGKKSPRKDSFSQHLKIHEGKQHKCDQCPKAFVLPTQLRLHKKRDHGADSDKERCCFCGSVFKKFAALRAHMIKSHGYNVISKKMFFNELPTMKEEHIKDIKVEANEESAES